MWSAAASGRRATTRSRREGSFPWPLNSNVHFRSGRRSPDSRPASRRTVTAIGHPSLRYPSHGGTPPIREVLYVLLRRIWVGEVGDRCESLDESVDPSSVPVGVEVFQGTPLARGLV